MLRWLLRDISSLLAAERRSCAERDFAEAILDNAQAIVLVLDNDRIDRVNLYLCAGRPAIRRRTCSARTGRCCFPKTDRPAVQQIVCAGR